MKDKQQYTLAPRIRARTPIGILKGVIKAIREEPKRYDQGNWLALYTEDTAVEDLGLPSCGTVGCVAGWVSVLTRPSQKVARGRSFFSVANRAKRVLGLTEAQAERLFAPEAVNIHLHPGTKAYAKAGVKHIEKFMRDELGYKGPKL